MYICKSVILFLFPIFILITILLFLLWISRKIFPNKTSKEITMYQMCPALIILYLIWLWLINYFLYIQDLPSDKIASYKYTINVLSVIDNVNLGNTQIANVIRMNLYKQYKSIKNILPDDSYTIIGIFNDINNEYIKIKSKYGSNSDDNYENLYKEELKNNLKEYIFRNKTIDNMTYGYFSDYLRLKYVIPNRIVFYPKLALSYLSNGNILKTRDSIQELTDILNNFEIVLTQEKNIKTSQYNLFKNGIGNQKEFKYTYPIFINQYSKAIILITKDIDNNNLCSKTDIFDYYLKSIYEYKQKADPIIFQIINDECKYN